MKVTKNEFWAIVKAGNGEDYTYPISQSITATPRSVKAWIIKHRPQIERMAAMMISPAGHRSGVKFRLVNCSSGVWAAEFTVI